MPLQSGSNCSTYPAACLVRRRSRTPGNPVPWSQGLQTPDVWICSGTSKSHISRAIYGCIAATLRLSSSFSDAGTRPEMRWYSFRRTGSWSGATWFTVSTPLLIDAYPDEWPTTVEKMGELEFDSLGSGHGPVQHGRAMSSKKTWEN